MMTSYTVTFPGSWVEANQFERALCQIPIYSFSKSTEVTFHFPSSCKIMIDAAVRLLSLANQLVSEEMAVTLIFEDEQNDAMPYLNRANFFTLLSQQVRVLPAWPDPSLPRRLHGHSKRLVEFEPISPVDSKEARAIPTKLTDTLTAAIEGHPNVTAFSSATFLIFTELINNVLDHSQTGGFAVLQAYPNGQQVQVAVSDSGVGLLETLRPKLLTQASKDLSDAELIRHLFRNELEWESGGNGQGLYMCAHQALKYNGGVDIRLSTCRIQLQPSDGSYRSATTLSQSNLIPIKGTHVCFSFRLPGIA